MPVVLDYRNTIQNYIHKPGRSVWAQDLVAAAVINNGNLNDEQILQICDDIDNGATTPSFALPATIGNVIPEIVLKELTHVANVNCLVPNQTIRFCHEGITVLFGFNGSGKSGYFRMLNKFAGGSIDYTVMQNIYDDNPQPMSASILYSENGTDCFANWDFVSPLNTPLGHIRVFDNNYAKIFIAEHDTNTYLFDTMGLKIYRAIHDGFNRIKEFHPEVLSEEAEIMNLCTAGYSEKLVRALENQFKEELNFFEMDYLNVSLQMDDMMDPLSKIKLSIQNNHSLDKVLSEAELKCCAIALFIAECELLEKKQPVIFDDPVNSLDASVIGMFASRLGGMACPVVLFTHNTQLLEEILNLDEVKVYDNPDKKRDSAKKHALVYEIVKDSPKEVGYVTYLKECKCKHYLEKAKDILDNHSNPMTREYQKMTADNLRMAVEWIIDEVFFRNLVPNRFRGKRDFIQWAELEVMVNQNSADVRAIHTIYSKLSSADTHVGIAHVLAPLPKATLLNYYNTLKTLVDGAGL